MLRKNLQRESMSKNKITSINSFKYAKDIIRSIKRERFLKKSSKIQRDYQKALILIIDLAEEIFDAGIFNKEFGDFLIEESKILKEIGGKHKEK